MNNQWNKKIYKKWSPIYDYIFNTGRFHQARKKIFQSLEIKKHQRVLFVGVGTGADLKFIQNDEIDITAIDLSVDMLQQAKKKFPNSSIRFIEMDAEQLEFENEQFDIVIASLILSVVPNSEQCLKEMIRVLKSKGEIVIFDKFSPKGKELSFTKKMLRPLVRILGTDIGLSFEKLYKNQEEYIIIKEDIPLMWNGMYRKIVLKHKSSI